MAGEQREREVITELLELYRDLPCLWDLSSESHKDLNQKKNAWDILATKLKDIDPTANAATAKKKIDNLRISFIRESKKVKESKNRTGSSTSDIHKPNLWYYDLMTFLDKKNDVKRKGIDSLKSDDENEQQIRDGTKRKKLTKEQNIEIKKEKLLDTATNLLTQGTETNAFGVYVGKKIEEIPLGQQRDLAEKLISEIMFLAKTNNLTFDTRIEIPSRTHHSAQSYFVHSPPSISSNSYQYIQTESNASTSSLTQRFSPSPATSHSYLISQPVNSPPANCPILIQSPTSPSYHTQHPSPASFHSYLISQPENSPSPNCPVPIQSPTSPSSYTHHPSPTSCHSYQVIPNSSLITHPNSTPSSQNPVNISENTVLYAGGPAEGILKELLVFRKHK